MRRQPRQGVVNRKLAVALTRLAPLELQLREIPIRDQPSAIVGTSPGKIGTAVAQQHLRSILAFCNSPLMNAIEAYIEFTPGLITDEGEVTVDSTREFLANYMKEFHGFSTRVYTAIPRTSGAVR